MKAHISVGYVLKLAQFKDCEQVILMKRCPTEEGKNCMISMTTIGVGRI
jgi:hypothetical protein